MLTPICENSGSSRLSWATMNGHGGGARLLSGRKGVIPNWFDNTGQTPLSWAAENRYDGTPGYCWN